MPQLTIPIEYSDGSPLTATQLTDALTAVSTLLNTTKLDSSNIQTGGISADNLASNAVTSSKVAANAVGTAAIVDASVTLPKLDSTVTSRFMPSGVILPFGGTAAPSGYLLCDGTAVSRVTYSDLFTAIGVAFGEGNGATTFHLPDLRGRFLRGTDNAAGRDPDAASRTAMATGGNAGDNVGSVQSHQYASHNHNITDPGHRHTINGFQPPGTNLAGSGGGTLQGSYQGDTSTTGITINNSGGNETRPINVGVNYIIKT